MKNPKEPQGVRKTKTNVLAPEEKGNVLQVTARPGLSEERQLADLATDGVASNALTAARFLGPTQPGLAITEMMASLTAHGQRINRNDFAAAEQMLTAQAVALNAIFAELARRSALNMGEHLDASERYMRLAFKAQGQCRATVETLAAIKNPPVFTRQANIANGPQQVNYGTGTSNGTSTHAHAPAHGKTKPEQAQLLAEDPDGSTLMDAGTAATAAGGNSAVEAVGTVNRPHERRGEGAG